MSTPSRSTPPNEVVEVLVDGTGRVGSLSYLVPTGLKIAVGDAVHVPFGKRELHGVVLGAGNPSKATREIIDVYGRRSTPTDIAVLGELAARHFSTVTETAARLSPSAGRGASALAAGDARLVETKVALPEAGPLRRLYLTSPLAESTEIAASEALRMLDAPRGGQVLILCPTRSLVEETLQRFASGAVRLDAQAPAGAWRSFVEGSAPVGVGTRVSSFYAAERLAGIIVVDPEHPGHREASQPYWNSTEVALARARAHGCALTIVSAAPPLKALSGVKVVALPGDWPSVRVIDPTTLAPSARQAPPAVLGAAKKAHTRGAEVVVVTDGQGRRLCARCRTPRPCDSCPEQCSHLEAPPCPQCQATATRWVGLAASTARVRYDADRVLQLDDLAALSAAPRLVVVPEADRFLSPSSFEAEVTAYRTLARLAHAAGRGGELILVSASETPALSAFTRRDPAPLLQQAWSEAKKAGMPPHGHILTIRLGSEKEPQIRNAPGTLFGPRRRGKEWEIVLRFATADHAAVAAFIARLRRRGKVRVALQ